MSTAPVALRQLHSKEADFPAALSRLLQRDAAFNKATDQVEQTVRAIINQVRSEGDRALWQLTRELDGFTANSQNIEISQARLQLALDNLPAEQRNALQYAADRIRKYHQHQKQQSWQYQEADGTILGQKISPIKRAGLYVPGGTAAYPSSVLMNAIPAKVAGVEELLMVSPTPRGELNEMVLAAACLAGVDKVLRIGGAQAVAALAYGTESIKPVDKITGPGNIYVATAKKQVFGKVGIDLIAGPSEVLVIADGSVDARWVAMDLFAQAEHDELAQSILLTESEAMAGRVYEAINELLPTMERKRIIAKSLTNNGAMIVAQSRDDMISIAEQIAPEHLQIFTQDAQSLAKQIANAGAIFIGPFSAESLGDYCAGPNHVLPTSGSARFSSPLGVYDFQKRSSIIQVSAQGAQDMGKNAAIIARGEALTAHARSAEYRLTSTDPKHNSISE